MTSETTESPQVAAERSAAKAPRSGIVWLASYPKSGNTWTRAFLHNLVRVTSGEIEAQQINELNQFSLTSAAKPLFDEILGFSATDKHLNQIAAARARVQQHVADLVEGLVFVKTHQALAVDRGYPTINFSVTAGAIYIVRNPLDVAISYAHHLSASIDATMDLMNQKNAETASGHLRDALRGYAFRSAKDFRCLGAPPAVQAERKRACRGHRSLVIRTAARTRR